MCHDLTIVYKCSVCATKLRVGYDTHICPKASSQKNGRLGSCGSIRQGSKDNKDEMCSACEKKSKKMRT